MTRNSPWSLVTGTTTSMPTCSRSSSASPTLEALSLYQVRPFCRPFCISADLRTDSALVYFAQGGSYLGPISGTNPDPVTSKVGFNENATLPFQPGKTYRLRIVNTSAFAAFFFWIDGHDMRIIEVDGVRSRSPTYSVRC